MAPRTLYLISYRRMARDRAHFAIWTPYEEGGQSGTLIHVVGAPMAGYQLEFKRSYKPNETQEPKEMIEIGKIDSQYVHDWSGERGRDSTPKGNLGMVAAQLQPPRVSENFMAPVNDTTDFVRRLVEIHYVNQAVLDKVQAQRDQPSHGIGLQRVARVAPAQPLTPQQGTQSTAPSTTQPQAATAQAAGQSTDWIWDEQYQKYRRYDGSAWIWQ